MAGDTQDGPSDQASPPDSPVQEAPDRRPVGSSDLISDQDGQAEALGPIPDLDEIRAVTRQLIVNIGVLAGSIHGGTVSAAGQSSQSKLGEATSRAGVTHWQVQAKELHRLHQVFIPVPSVIERATKVLESRHVVVLQGRTNWGKSTTAQWLLTHQHHERVFLVDPRDDRKLSSLAEALEGDGYVLDTLGSEHATQLRPATLLRLSEHLQAPGRIGHLVITVDALTSLPTEAADYIVVCQETPDASDVLWRHLTHEVGEEKATEALLRTQSWVAERYRNAPSPGRMRDLAEALAMMVRRGGQVEVAKRVYQQHLFAYVAEWFRQHPGARERCFMTAAAVLNGASYQYVSWAAEQLETLVSGEEAPPRYIPRGWGRPFSPRLERVEDIGAKLRQPIRGSVGGPLAVIELEEPLVQTIVLAHLWDKHDDIFNHLIAWLDDLGRSQYLEISGRAAAAAGTLCAVDFDYLQDALLWPWATDQATTSPGNYIARISSAIALTTAAREPDLVQRVLNLLSLWSGPGSRIGSTWTAATAFGMLDPELPPIRAAALQGLRSITEHHHLMSWVAAHSLANLCTARYAPEALGALRQWLYEPPPSPLAARARTVLNRLTRLRVQHPDGSLGVPVLLHLSMEHHETADAVRLCWYDLLESNHPELEDAAQQALDSWLALTEDDEHCHNATWSLMYPLLEHPETRRRTRSALRRHASREERGWWTVTQLLDATRKPSDIVLDWTWDIWQRYRSRARR